MEGGRTITGISCCEEERNIAEEKSVGVRGTGPGSSTSRFGGGGELLPFVRVFVLRGLKVPRVLANDPLELIDGKEAKESASVDLEDVPESRKEFEDLESDREEGLEKPLSSTETLRSIRGLVGEEAGEGAILVEVGEVR